MRFLAIVVLAVALAACGSSSPSVPPPSTLHVDIQPGFIANAKPQHYTLTCNPAGGTVPRPADACKALAADPALLTSASCTVGIPDIGARAVTGTWQGKPVSISYRGCNGDAARWTRMARALGLIS